MSYADRNIKVVIVDDHPMIREGIAGVLASEPGMELVGEAQDGFEAIEQFRARRPDVTLMDLEMPNMDGLAALSVIRNESPTARVLILTTYRGDARAVRALKAGAAGYVLKNRIRKELTDAIRQVHSGKRYVDPEVASEIGVSISEDELTPREVEVLRNVARGAANKTIAATLGVSEGTIKSHMKSVLAKLHANDRTHAVVIALERGIIERARAR